MKTPDLFAAKTGLIFLLVLGTAAESGEIKVLAANGIQAVVEDLKFERASGFEGRMYIDDVTHWPIGEFVGQELS